jgi:hypothetical protein
VALLVSSFLLLVHVSGGSLIKIEAGRQRHQILLQGS